MDEQAVEAVSELVALPLLASEVPVVSAVRKWLEHSVSLAARVRPSTLCVQSRKKSFHLVLVDQAQLRYAGEAA